MPGIISRWQYLRYRYSLKRIVDQKSVDEGLLGGDRLWLAVFIAVRVFLAVKRAATRTSERVSIDQLKPGEGVVIRTIGVRNGKERARVLRGG